MPSLHGHLYRLLFLLLLALGVTSDEAAKVAFVNVSEEPVKVYWNEKPDGTVVDEVAQVAPGEGTSLDSQVGHVFSYHLGGQSYTVTVEEADTVIVLGGETVDKVQVKCSTTKGDLRLTIVPQWSPYGAARFLHLVRIGYFDGCALNRVVKGFLTQFGIGADYEARTQWRRKSIPDDKPRADLKFQPGYLSYAGSGPNSRSTEVFVVMPDTREHHLQHFGTNAWETPFGYVEPQDLGDTVAKWESYGDMPPWGKGPAPQKIYPKDGYDYLKQEFPKLDYIEKCQVVSSSQVDDKEL